MSASVLAKTWNPSRFAPVAHAGAHDAADTHQAAGKRPLLVALVVGDPDRDPLRRIGEFKPEPAVADLPSPYDPGKLHPLRVKAAEINAGKRYRPGA